MYLFLHFTDPYFKVWKSFQFHFNAMCCPFELWSVICWGHNFLATLLPSSYEWILQTRPFSGVFAVFVFLLLYRQTCSTSTSNSLYNPTFDDGCSFECILETVSKFELGANVNKRAAGVCTCRCRFWCVDFKGKTATV